MTSLTITAENMALFDKIKLEKYYSYILFGLSIDNSALEFRGSGERNYNFNSLASELPKDKPMFVIYDFIYETNENPPRRTSKLLFIFWSPTTAPMRQKFAFTNAQYEVKNAFKGIQKDFQLSDYPAIDYDQIRNELLKT